MLCYIAIISNHLDTNVHESHANFRRTLLPIIRERMILYICALIFAIEFRINPPQQTIIQLNNCIDMCARTVVTFIFIDNMNLVLISQRDRSQIRRNTMHNVESTTVPFGAGGFSVCSVICFVFFCRPRREKSAKKKPKPTCVREPIERACVRCFFLHRKICCNSLIALGSNVFNV